MDIEPDYSKDPRQTDEPDSPQREVRSKNKHVSVLALGHYLS